MGLQDGGSSQRCVLLHNGSLCMPYCSTKNAVQVDSKSSNPINSILCTTILSVLLGLISVWSPVAFNDVISLTLAAFYLSYFGASSLLLWRRCTGSIRTLAEVPPAEDAERLMNLPNSEGKLIGGYRVHLASLSTLSHVYISSSCLSFPFGRPRFR